MYAVRGYWKIQAIRIHSAYWELIRSEDDFEAAINRQSNECEKVDRLSDSLYKITAFSHLRGIPYLPIALNLETLDKLYRYQSTLQKQLSNCIGELLVLNKSTTIPRVIAL